MAVVAEQAVILRADISTGSCMASPVASNFMISPEQSATMVICALRPLSIYQFSLTAQSEGIGRDLVMSLRR
ncbi:hypothetical protein [Mesorhizobium sp.]|uniref:hypothetical protein n=1 Tax=Mesorhizobium sp. TaxID=1871066 RepID=UPI000FE36EF8|nr:hypothetical protein [Mesorhizobium sp.]RWC01467.1 MAG: hypothetical protein EOQ56_13260 [Mesorhizobium sp.]RWP34147.1 MAG: hypothetical protein EOR02_00860 [Mesorhizobium sp.]RWP69981.1 MAG: hypothetical protein EOR07_01325 [Mesorhizobium sp.]RWQ22662.1 MAG: hypothetical protein EOR92_06445 [Mesorhizobium sp.]